jgi:AcrR family transcriptional regulator
MEDPVKRSYNSANRRSAAERTRRRIIDEASQMFLAQGYARTSIESIAEKAEVSPATVYKVFTNKVAIVKAVGDVAVVGDHEAVALDHRDWVRSAMTETDSALAIEMIVRNGVAVLARISPIIDMISAAALAEPELADLAEAGDHGRRQGFRAFVASLHARGQLRDGLSIDDGTDLLYALQSPQMFLTLVQRRGWSVERFGDWLIDLVCHALLGP